MSYNKACTVNKTYGVTKTTIVIADYITNFIIFYSLIRGGFIRSK